MQTKESVIINAPPETIWPLIAEPLQWNKWQPKVVEVKAFQTNMPALEGRYRATMRMRKDRPVTQMDLQIRKIDPPRNLVIEGTESFPLSNKNPHKVRLEFVLIPRAESTEVQQIVDMDLSELNIFLRMLIWFILKFGKPVASSVGPLEGLKRAVEGKAVA